MLNFSVGKLFGLDLVKTFCPILVVVAHCVPPVYGYSAGGFIYFLVRLAVPLYLLMFGYFLDRSCAARGYDRLYILQRFLGYLVPFIFWSAIYYLLFVPDVFNSRVDFTKYFLGFGWPGQYFFYLVLEFSILHLFLRKFYSQNWCIALVFVFTLIFYFIFRYFPRILPDPLYKTLGFNGAIYLFYFAFGCYVNRRSLKVGKIIPLIALLLFAAEFIHLAGSTLHRHSPLRIMPSVLLLATAIFGMMWHRSFEINLPRWVWWTINKLKKNTFSVFVLNPLFIWFTHHYVDHLGFGFQLVYALLVVVLCILTAEVMRLLRLRPLVF